MSTVDSDNGWRAAISDKLSWATLISLAAASVLSFTGMSTSPRILALTLYVFAPGLLLLAATRILRQRDYRLRAWVTIGTLTAVGIASAATVGLLAGTANALFLALILASLLFGQRAMLALLGGIILAVCACAYLFVSGVLPPPLEEDVSFAYASTWLRTGGNALFLLFLGALATAQVVKELEAALARVRREAAERERAQEERTRALELALQSQKVEVAGRLATGLAHDLNNALFVIDACNQALQRRSADDAGRAETHAAINDAVQQSSALARQLLSFARKHVAAPVAIATRELTDELRRSVTRLFPSDVKLEVSCEDDATLRADKVHLQQAVLNLCINARDAIGSDGEVSVRAASVELKQAAPAVNGPIPPGRYVSIEVRDNGSGMDAATQARAFEPLFTTKPEGKGTGLGLPSVLSTVEMSGGYLALYSEVGRGTRFTIYLPQIESTPSQARAIASSGPRSDLRGLNVLLVEDSPTVRGVIAGALAQQGCNVLQARDGSEALAQIATAKSIDVLCTDAVMPGAPVREVIARLEGRHPDASVVIISGYVADELTRRGIEQGRYHVLAKPFATQRLTETIGELCERKRRAAS